MIKTMVKTVMVKMPDKLHKAARLKSVAAGVSLSEVIRDLLALWLDGKIDLSTPETKSESKPRGSKP